MASVTGLQLINRVMLLRRHPTISSFVSSNPEHQVVLNALNMAKDDILGTRDWDFDLRHDGQLATRAIKDVTFFCSAGSSFATVSGSNGGTDLFGNYVVRVLPTGNTEYANTAFRMNYISNPTLGFVVLAVAAPTTFAVSTAAKLVYSEYILPDNVRSVARVSYQEEELNLDLIDPHVGFDEWVPNGHVDSGEPRVMAIGGRDVRTYDATATTPNDEPGLRAIIWPPPDDEYVLNYSYYINHADLVDGDSVLEGVSESVLNQIVNVALGIVKMAWDGDYAASHFMDLGQSNASVLHRINTGSKDRRHSVRSWDSGSARVAIELGFPGKEIG